MAEIQLQSKIAVEFSQRFPKKRGQLFHVPNERNNQTQVYQASAIGIISGVSDFIYFDENGIKGIEVKEPGSYHKIDHIRNQVEWGKVLEGQGGKYVIVRSIEQAFEAMDGGFWNCLEIYAIEKMLSEAKGKTIRF